MMTFHIFTFGCQMNENDSAWLSRALRRRGFEEAPPERADVLFLNTCSVREKPELKVYSLLGRLAAHRAGNPDMFAAVGGCVAVQAGEAFFERFPFVRLVFGADGLNMVPQAVERLAAEPSLRLNLVSFSEGYAERDPAWPDDRVPGQAFVNIMQGCDNYCAYCIVPYVRGRQRSRRSGDILTECRELVQRGAREITLLGQNVNAYGLDRHGDGVGFPALLRDAAAIPDLVRLRFTTSHPKDLSDEVIRAFAELPALCPQLHLPLQSGSDAVLRAMGRGYDLRRYLSLVDRLRQARPDMALTTDLIVGFPGETETDFQATLAAIGQAGFEGSFSFMYCDRPGVRAERMRPKVPDEIKADRLARLQEVQDGFTKQALGRMVGRKTTLLLEGASRKQDGLSRSWQGRDPYNHVVNVLCPEAADLRGEMVAVRITEAKRHSLSAEREGGL